MVPIRCSSPLPQCVHLLADPRYLRLVGELILLKLVPSASSQKKTRWFQVESDVYPFSQSNFVKPGGAFKKTRVKLASPYLERGFHLDVGVQVDNLKPQL